MARALVHAHVRPMDHPDSVAEAVLFDDTILAVGDDATITRLAEEQGIPVEDAGGRVVIPGFVDAHMHFLHVGIKRTRPDLRGTRSKQEAMQRCSDWLAANPGTGPVIAEGWDEADWAGDPPPTKHELDAVAADRPLVWRRICGHKAVANSKALPMVHERWPDERVDATTGVLLEEPSLYLNEVLPADDATLDAAVGEASRVAHHLGVTTVGDYEQWPLREALLRGAADGRLGVRVQCSLYAQDLRRAIAAGFRTGRPVVAGPDGAVEDPDSRLRDGGLKIFLDGSLGGHTALMLEPYGDRPDTKGRAIWSDDELDDLLTQAHQNGIQVHAHAIGDGAVEQGLQGFERLRDALGGPLVVRPWQMGGDARGEGGDAGVEGGDAHGEGGTGPEDLAGDAETPHAAHRPPAEARAPGAGGGLAHRFEHYEIVHDDQVARTAALGIWASSQPNFVGAWSAHGGMYQERIGDRFALNNRFQTFLQAGVRIAFGSDGMPFGPLVGIQAAVEHPVAKERMTAAQAIWHYTHEGAAALGRDDVGVIAPGRRADLLVFDMPDLDRPPKEWVLQETIIDGETVHRGDRPCPSDDDV